MTEREVYHQYQKGNRVAKVFKTKLGFEVDLIEGTDFHATRKVHNTFYPIFCCIFSISF